MYKDNSIFYPAKFGWTKISPRLASPCKLMTAAHLIRSLLVRMFQKVKGFLIHLQFGCGTAFSKKFCFHQCGAARSDRLFRKMGMEYVPPFTVFIGKQIPMASSGMVQVFPVKNRIPFIPYPRAQGMFAYRITYCIIRVSEIVG